MTASHKPIQKPKYPTWAVLEPGNLPPYMERLLGSIIPHSALYQPLSDYILPEVETTLQKIIAGISAKPTKVEDGNATAFIKANESNELKGQLSSLLDIRTHKSHADEYTIETQAVCTRALMNPPKILKELLQDKETRVQLQALLDRDGKADMIVGLKTCVDAQLNYFINDQHGANLGAEIPINAIVAALGGPPIPLDLNASASANLEKIREYVAKHQAKGERIFALQYKRVMTVGRWAQVKSIEMDALEQFQVGLFAGDEENDYEDDDIILCPMGELPEDQWTM